MNQFETKGTAMSENDDSYIDSLERLLSILYDQIALARSIGVPRVAVTIEDLERLLGVLEGGTPK